MRKEPFILGLSSSNHNGAACLLKGRTVVAAVQEERLTRIKRSGLEAGSPSLAVRYCLEAGGIRPSQLDAIVTCFLRDRESPLHDVTRNALLADARCPTFTISHHLGHAVSTFGASGFDRAAVLVVDGAGSRMEDLDPEERAVAALPCALPPEIPDALEAHSLYSFTGNRATPIEKQMGWWVDEEDWDESGMKMFGGLGGMYSAVARQIFGDALDAPGKVMGLFPFGKPDIPVEEFVDITPRWVIPRMDVRNRFRFAERWPAHKTLYENLAASTQAALERALLAIVHRLRVQTSATSLCYAGGVALNGVANERIFREAGFDDVFILPASEDGGTALGAAFYGLSRLCSSPAPRLCRDSLGASYSRERVASDLNGVPACLVREPTDLVGATVDLLLEQRFVGWFQGGSEFGPRALGCRSILCDPRRAEMKDLLNERIKRREGFRPFAPIVLAEEARHWFDVPPDDESAFMLRVWPFRPGAMEKVPAVAHVDGTGRVQTVTREANPRLHSLVTEFFRRTGVPIVLNTSLNVAGDPIVETPEDAAYCLFEGNLDACVIGDRIVTKASGHESVLDLLIVPVKQWAELENPVRVQTRWGSFHRTVPQDAIDLLRCLSAPRSGLELLEHPDLKGRVKWPQLFRLLSLLRSAGLVRYATS